MKQKEIRFTPASRKFEGLYQFGGKYRYKIFSGGRASAKSWGIAEALIYVTRTFKARILCCREIQKSIKESAYQLIKDTAERYGVSDEYVFTRERITHIETGSYFVFEGLYHNTNKIKSMEGIDIAWVEEAESVSEQSWAMLFPTIRKANSEIWISFNPRYTTDPTWDLVSNPRPKSFIQHMTYEDNPFLSDAIREEIEHDRTKDPQLFRWVWLGQPMTQNGSVLISDAIVSSAIARSPLSIEAPLIGALDVARTGDDFSALVVRKGNEVVAIERWKTPDLMDLVDRVAQIHTTLPFNYLFVDVVGIGAGVYDGLKRKSGGVFELRQFNGASQARKPQVFANLRAECWFHMRDWLKEHGNIPNDKILRLELTSLQYMHDKQNRWLLESKDDLKKRGGKSPDLSDALSMTFAPLIETPKPKLENKPKRMGYYG